MYDLMEIIRNSSGPIPHIALFFTLACIVGWWTKEFRATLTLMIIWSIGAEYLQIYFPIAFDFDVTDIWWNLCGSSLGLAVTSIALFLCSGWITREQTWNDIRREAGRGDYS
jgi:glycopeptide antibiotics resistance protein